MSEDSNNDTEEVLNFLQQMKDESDAQTDPTPQVERSVHLDEDEMRELKGIVEEAPEDRGLDVPEIPVVDDFKHRPYQDMFTALVADIGKVEVNDFEKDLFIKSVLNDSQYVTTSSILGGRMTMKIKSRTMYTDKLIFDALNKDEQLKLIAGMDSMVYRLQMYVAACQLQSYGGKNTDYNPDPHKSFEENYKTMNEHVDKVLSTVPVHVWGAIVMGIRIHEYKSKICLDNLNNENFWESAGIN